LSAIAEEQFRPYNEFGRGPNSVYILVNVLGGRLMKLSDQVKPISYLKAHAPEVIRNLAEGREPVIITLHGEAKAVLQDIASYEQTQETLALLKILALGNRSIEEGRVRPVSEALATVRQRIKG
jgi:prevent-host-death family protein